MRLPIILLLLLAAPIAPVSPTPALAQGGEAQRRSYPIFFEPWSAALGDAARAGLGEAATLARQRPAVPILVTGYADPAGSSEANVLLSRLRATVVADELKRHGVAAERIRLEWRGPTSPAFENLESRRVEVSVDPTR
jgi:outer membrane protein OmpA-like peptidoglycan-associated protein